LITDSDLNAFYTWCINSKLDIRRTKDKYREILDILNTNIDKEKLTLHGNKRAECLKAIIEIIIEGNSVNYATENVLSTQKYNDEETRSYITTKYDEKINDENFQEVLKRIENQTKIAVISKQVPELENMIDELIDGNFDRIDEGYKLIKKVSNELNTAVNKVEKSIANSSESRVVIGRDSLKQKLENKILRYNKENKIPTGFKYIDEKIMYGGIEKNRLYILAGNSGSGKSTMLANMALNAAKYEHYIGELSEKKKIFVYITLENDIEESLGRIMCAHWGISNSELDTQIVNDVDKVDKKFFDELDKYNSYIDVRQFNVESISATNIGVIIDDLVEEFGGSDKCLVAAVYVDYLDLIKSDGSKKDYRLVLQDITSQLKELARDYNLPVVTATQLNRESYRVKSSFELNAALVAESIGKVNIADFIALMAKNSFDPTLVHFKVGKFRSGNPDVPLDFKVNFEHYKFIDCKPSENPKDKKKEKDKSKNIDNCGILPCEEGFEGMGGTL
jgi:replicative DNA helicase